MKGNKNGILKEYNNDGTIKFEGEYLKGKIWNGIGYKYFQSNRSISIDIKKGKGKGSLYINGELEFEGEYRDGEKYKGKEYWNGELKFEGEYKNGKKFKGKEYYENKLEFEGEFLDGVRWKGKEYTESGIIKANYSFGQRKVNVFCIIV